ncbi:MAG TPA: LuxR C-terminal-related transcriptional regulator [Acidimicrobiales bacterium]|nr:LuxR C-terminal-related transcriptional regulator [Acidimicrobiales bacterium]
MDSSSLRDAGDSGNDSDRSPHAPPPGLFVGRDAELQEVLDLLREARLVTITGAPGVGKSAFARHVVGSAPHSIFWLNLASIADPEDVPPLIPWALGAGGALAYPAIHAVRRPPQDDFALLVLDNCEHLISVVSPLVEAVLDRHLNLRILITSREPLRIEAETVLRLPPLSLPRPGCAGVPDAFVESDAVRLFCQRAAAVERGFIPTADNVAAIVEICNRLDGLPLAIDLAARRVEALSPADIAAYLRSSFELLNNATSAALPRHASLRANLNWSYHLLEAQEQVLWRRLSVFAGGFTLDAAQIVAIGDHLGSDEVVWLLARLVSKSLVVADTSRPRTRYRLLETVRHFAHEKLEAADESDAVAARHADWCLASADDPAVLGGSEPPEERQEPDRENLAAALEWSLATDRAETALLLAMSHAVMCRRDGVYASGRDGLERALSLPTPVSPTLRAEVLIEAWSLTHDLSAGDLPGSRARLEEALHLARNGGDTRAEARSLHHLGRLARSEGDEQEAVAHQLDAFFLQTATGDREGLADTLEALAGLAISSRHVAHSARLFGAATALRAETGCVRTLSGQAAYEADLELARQRLGTGPFEAGWQVGLTSPEVTADYAAKFKRPGEPVMEPGDRLTPAESKVRDLVAEGMTNAEVAEHLFVSVRTVESHLRSVFLKLGINSRRDLVTRSAMGPAASGREERHPECTRWTP